MLELGLKVLIAYVLGSIVGALAVGQLRGVDIRTMGSGNAGGTNALRTQGFGFAAATVIIDVGKGWMAAGCCRGLTIPGVVTDPVVSRDWLAVSCAAAAVVGHIWPLWHDFRGGKGGATFAGALLALAPMLLVVAVGAWLFVAMLTGFVGLATVMAAGAAALAAGWSPLDPGRCLHSRSPWCRSLRSRTAATSRACAQARNRAMEKFWLLRPRDRAR